MKVIAKPVLKPILDWWARQKLPPGAKAERRADRAGVVELSPTAEASIAAALDWLGTAQDRSASADGGVSRHWSYLTGWSTSYPETTGYIVPTLLNQATIQNQPALKDRAERMLDWLVSIQFSNGGFQGGIIGQHPCVPVTFNTGQILLGLAAGARTWGDRYYEAMRRSADWLARTLDDDGCWRKFPSPFVIPGDKTYETHVSWGLIEALKIEPNEEWESAVRRQVDWALTMQMPNGWMASCCLSDPAHPLTHTLGYALRGILEAWRFSREARYRLAAENLAHGLLQGLRADGGLPGRFSADWRPAVDWVCLTGAAQIAHCWLMLYEDTRMPQWQQGASRAITFVRRTVSLDGPEETRGGVKGSFPLDGDYCAYQYPNWSAKFFIDASQLELDIAPRGRPA